MPYSYLSLNEPWKFKGFADCNGEELGANKAEYPDEDWLPAKIPGTVHLDLIANKVIEDPFKDLNERKDQWIADIEWWYRKEIELPPEVSKRQIVELVFEGLDTYATVWVNGMWVGEADNMFFPWRFDITDAVKEGSNVVAVKFKPVYAVARELERRFGRKYGSLCAENFSARPFVRKAQYSFGWDWGPTLPTSGIWRGVSLVAYDNAAFGYVSTLPLKVSADKAVVKAAAEVYAATPCRVEVKFVLEGFGQQFERHVTTRAHVGRNDVECLIDIDDPRLWWPNGCGEPNIYDLSVKLFLHGDAQLDKVAVKCGIRKVELLQEPDEEGKSFVFRVNGLPVFCKGASWIPSDSFLPRVTSQRYRRLLGLAAEANMNMVRVWGGGVYEDEAFYSLCDELGLMVWQDFMYANSAYPEDRWFLKAAEREAEAVIRRLRGHPCIVVWCGNNEVHWLFETLWKDMPRLFGRRIFEKIIPRVLNKLDGTRPYRVSTPYNSEANSEHEGTRHNWDVWSGQADYPSYLEDKGRFLTEFGWQSPATLNLLSEYLDEADLKSDSPSIGSHEKQVNGLLTLERLLSLHYPAPKDLRQWVLFSQLNQADALEAAVTHWRSRIFKTSGCLIWQLNDCWPSVSWSLIDYGLNPKASYYAVKRAFQPIIAPLIVKDGKVYGYVVNETTENLRLSFCFRILKFSGKELYVERKSLVTGAQSSVLVQEHDLDDLPVDDNAFLTVSLERQGKTLWEQTKTVAEPKDLKFPQPTIILKTRDVGAGKLEIGIESDLYAKAVYLGASDTTARFSENFFDLIPCKPRTVSCWFDGKLKLRDFRENIVCQAYPYA